MESPIGGGATMWARQTVQSDVFNTKPDKWFKIWFFIVNRVNFKDTQQWKRGECFIPTGEIEHSCRATKDQVKKCLTWLRNSDSISTKRSTRGIHLKVLKYNIYQDVESYRSTKKAPEKHQRSTTIGEEGNKEINLGETSSPLKDNENTMGWNNPNDNDSDLPEINDDGQIEDTNAEKLKKENEKVRALMEWGAKVRGKDFLDKPTQLKHIKLLKAQGISPTKIKDTFVGLIQSDYWKRQSRLPDFKTVVSTLKNER